MIIIDVNTVVKSEYSPELAEIRIVIPIDAVAALNDLQINCFPKTAVAEYNLFKQQIMERNEQEELEYKEDNDVYIQERLANGETLEDIERMDQLYKDNMLENFTKCDIQTPADLLWSGNINYGNLGVVNIKPIFTIDDLENIKLDLSESNRVIIDKIINNMKTHGYKTFCRGNHNRCPRENNRLYANLMV